MKTRILIYALALAMMVGSLTQYGYAANLNVSITPSTASPGSTVAVNVQEFSNVSVTHIYWVAVITPTGDTYTCLGCVASVFAFTSTTSSPGVASGSGTCSIPYGGPGSFVGSGTGSYIPNAGLSPPTGSVCAFFPGLPFNLLGPILTSTSTSDPAWALLASPPATLIDLQTGSACASWTFGCLGNVCINDPLGTNNRPPVVSNTLTVGSTGTVGTYKAVSCYQANILEILPGVGSAAANTFSIAGVPSVPEFDFIYLAVALGASGYFLTRYVRNSRVRDRRTASGSGPV